MVESLFPFVVPASQTGAPVTSHRIDFIDENDAGGILLALIEEIPDPRCPDPDKHFDKIRPADAEERNIRLSGNGSGQQGFSRPGLPHEQQILWEFSLRIGYISWDRGENR